ncbi:uncharacterized protein LOC134815135 [Bolinopsis microptera]|uniref:uncharacterized protein LOC134815135 n=1 Tax=Bolinopsis microptera TaxID=2820187 RepID=UPI003079D1B8
MQLSSEMMAAEGPAKTELKRTPDETEEDSKRCKTELPENDTKPSDIVKPLKNDENNGQSKDSNGSTEAKDETKIAYPTKKKYAIMMGFCGDGYRGMALNVGVNTIEEELITALLKCQFIKPENAREMGKMYFQRASRTDKGVSAARQVVSSNLNLGPDLKAAVSQLNEALPDNITVYDIIKATKHFDSHKFASSRVYEYNCPSFAMAPTLGDTWSGYRITPQVLAKVREFLQNFVGTKNYYNYTSNKSASDPSCFRYIRSISVSDPVIVEDIEYIRIFLHGDSFIYHQIRKITGMTIAVMRNVTPSDHLEKSFTKDRVDIPLAPGLGLVLDEVKMERYNKKFGKDGCHTPLVWDPYEEQVQDFKMKHILSVIHRKEKAESIMFNWLQTLKKHKFYTGDVLPEILTGQSGESKGADISDSGEKKDSTTTESAVSLESSTNAAK